MHYPYPRPVTTRTSSPYFSSEQRHRTELSGVLLLHYTCGNRQVGKNHIIDQRFNLTKFILRQGLEMCKVKTQAVARYKGSGLFDMIAENGAECFLKDMRSRMVAGRGKTMVRVHVKSYRLTGFE